jgi:hypothetical protein
VLMAMISEALLRSSKKKLGGGGLVGLCNA